MDAALCFFGGPQPGPYLSIERLGLFEPWQVSTLIQERKPDLGDPQQLVNFGTSGHRGTSENGTFTETHILAITQAVCDFRTTQQISGPLFIGKDTHALSGAAQRTAIEVLAGNDAGVFYLSPREQQIIRLRAGLENHAKRMTLENIGQQFGITKERVRQLQVRAMKKLRSLAEKSNLELP